MNCRICERTMGGVFTLHSQRHDIDVPVYRCSHCDAYFSDGGPVNYADANLVDYYQRHAEVIRARYERLFERVESTVGPGRFLDIGAGIGFSLDVARRRGWSARGLEPNRELVRHATGRGMDVLHGYLDGSLHGTYDFVLLDNVLEHVPDPIRFLRDAAHLVDRRGLLVIAVPPVDWLRKLRGAIPAVRNGVTRPQLNVFAEVDEHVNILGRRAMAALARRIGIRLSPARFHHSAVYDNPVYRALGLDDGYYFAYTH